MNKMKSRKKMIFGAGGVAVALSMALAALGPTGAYFTDTAQGQVSGTVGSIKVAGTDGTGTDSLGLTFTNLLPGTPQTVTSRYTNTGLNNQDVWVVFNNPEALHALNDLGTYGEFHLAANGTALLDSTNLSDGKSNVAVTDNTCGPFGPSAGLCNPLLPSYKLASDMAPGVSGNVSFTFAYAGKLVKQSEAGGGTWNAFPVAQKNQPAPTIAGYGLPYQIVATQVGQTP
ncbi:hypothetical protein [Cryobacterium sp. MLB-32]|uniref:hypothetical protein n=1 Tax=Cryobacterium sp. MLB-32 TaxID=1529318 RepID=UPI0012DFF118|nr:hypothetical protein [Cryobacterium sp. MLB-32]